MDNSLWSSLIYSRHCSVHCSFSHLQPINWAEKFYGGGNRVASDWLTDDFRWLGRFGNAAELPILRKKRQPRRRRRRRRCQRRRNVSMLGRRRRASRSSWTSRLCVLRPLRDPTEIDVSLSRQFQDWNCFWGRGDVIGSHPSTSPDETAQPDDSFPSDLALWFHPFPSGRQ